MSRLNGTGSAERIAGRLHGRRRSVHDTASRHGRRPRHVTVGGPGVDRMIRWTSGRRGARRPYDGGGVIHEEGDTSGRKNTDCYSTKKAAENSRLHHIRIRHHKAESGRSSGGFLRRYKILIF